MTKKVLSEGDLPEDILNHPIEVYLPLLEADEDNVKPVQKEKFTINNKDYFINRGRRESIPYFVWRAAKVKFPNL